MDRIFSPPFQDNVFQKSSFLPLLFHFIWKSYQISDRHHWVVHGDPFPEVYDDARGEGDA